MMGMRGRALVSLRLRAASASKAPAKKKGKGDSGPVAPPVSKEIRSQFVVGANVLKEGSDPPVKDDSEYPDWLWKLLDKEAALSELKRKEMSTLEVPELQRMVKLENRVKIKENNSLKAKA